MGLEVENYATFGISGSRRDSKNIKTSSSMGRFLFV